MTYASKTTFCRNNLKFLRPKVKKNLKNFCKKFFEFPHRFLFKGCSFPGTSFTNIQSRMMQSFSLLIVVVGCCCCRCCCCCCWNIFERFLHFFLIQICPIYRFLHSPSHFYYVQKWKQRLDVRGGKSVSRI